MRLITKAICNKGFCGNSTILSRSTFSIGGQVSCPQSLTAYSPSRYVQGRAQYYFKKVRFLTKYPRPKDARRPWQAKENNNNFGG